CSGAGDQYNPAIAPDGSGGAIIAWQDSRTDTSLDIYAERVSVTGAPQWAANGVAICAVGADSELPVIVSDGTSSATISWQDHRNGMDYDIYAQRVNPAGVPQWTANGIALSSAPADQAYPRIVSDGTGGAIVAWQDSRNKPDVGTNDDIYAQRVTSDGVP